MKTTRHDAALDLNTQSGLEDFLAALEQAHFECSATGAAPLEDPAFGLIVHKLGLFPRACGFDADRAQDHCRELVCLRAQKPLLIGLLEVPFAYDQQRQESFAAAAKRHLRRLAQAPGLASRDFDLPCNRSGLCGRAMPLPSFNRISYSWEENGADIAI